MELDYETVEKYLKEAPRTYLLGFLAIIVERCATEPVFKGWMGMHSFIQNTYKRKKSK